MTERSAPCWCAIKRDGALLLHTVRNTEYEAQNAYTMGMAPFSVASRESGVQVVRCTITTEPATEVKSK